MHLRTKPDNSSNLLKFDKLKSIIFLTTGEIEKINLPGIKEFSMHSAICSNKKFFLFEDILNIFIPLTGTLTDENRYQQPV